jgi:hypothetical protein
MSKLLKVVVEAEDACSQVVLEAVESSSEAEDTLLK